MEFPPDERRPDSDWKPKQLPDKLRIAFIHPDLGIGGAERLVVDAAVGLQNRGHHVEVFTSYHQDGSNGRSFPETRDGTLKVHVLGNTIFPPSIGGRFNIVCAILRQLHLSFQFLLATLLFHLVTLLPFLNPFLLPPSHPFTSSTDWSLRRRLAPFDVLVIDQLSASIPLLRLAGLNRVVFYCHFPDLLLAPDRSASLAQITTNRSLKGRVRALYRAPIDKLEEVTTGCADKIVVNSGFTAGVFGTVFRGLGRVPRVVYPAVDVHAYDKVEETKAEDKWLIDPTPFLLSINRFEGKKDVQLAIESFALAKAEYSNLRLVIAGGYDPRLPDNVATLTSLQALANSLNLTHATYCASLPPSDSPAISQTPPSSLPAVLFLPNMTSAHKRTLLTAPSIRALLYTPSFEHLGIVPLEAMSAAVPVLATASGGPLETLVDHGLDDGEHEAHLTTGLLRPPNPQVWATAIKDLVALPEARRTAIGEAGRKRARLLFSVETLGEELERTCKDAARVRRPVWQEEGTLFVLGTVGMAALMFAFGLVAIFA